MAISALVIDTRPPAVRRVGGGLDDPTPDSGAPARPVLAPVPEPVLEYDGVDELEAVRAALAAIVPAAPAGDVVLDLVRHVANKLAGHGAHCTAARHPPAGSLTLDEVRARCLALLDTLRPVERQAVLALLAADLDEAVDCG